MGHREEVLKEGGVGQVTGHCVAVMAISSNITGGGGGGGGGGAWSCVVAVVVVSVSII